MNTPNNHTITEPQATQTDDFAGLELIIRTATGATASLAGSEISKHLARIRTGAARALDVIGYRIEHKASPLFCGK